jgi:hypothetical protein
MRTAGEGKATKKSLAALWPALVAAFAGAVIAAACGGGGGNSSSGGGSSPVTVSGGGSSPATVSGAVVDGPVAGATVNAYSVSPSGQVSANPIATATTQADGSYSLKLPAGYTGTLLVASTGGTFRDDMMGNLVSGPALTALIPNVAAGTTSVGAQLTPVTTLAAQLALASASATNPVASVAAAVNTAIGTYLGGQLDIVGTPLVDVTTAHCASAANQASVDAALVVAGISKVAASNNVSTSDLIQALVTDLVSDGTFDGSASGIALTVPLSGGTTMLCTIEGNCAGVPVSGLAQQIGAAISSFQTSAANVCGATQSSSQQSALASPPSPSMKITYKYSYYVYGINVTGYTGTQPVSVLMSVQLNCTDDSFHGPFQQWAYFSSNGIQSITRGYTPPSSDPNYDFNPLNDCGLNTFSLSIGSSPGQNCTISGYNGDQFQSSDGGYTNYGGSDYGSPPFSTLACTPAAGSGNVTYSFGGTLSNLSAAGLVLQDNSGNRLTIPASQTFFTFPTQLTDGSYYGVSIATQPVGETCSVSEGGSSDLSVSGSINGANVTDITVSCTASAAGGPAFYVIDSTATLFAFDANGNRVTSVALPAGSAASIGALNGGGITTDANNVYVTLGQPANRVVAFNKTNLAPVALAAGSFASLNTPRGIAYDPHNQQFYVANGGSTVTVYNGTGVQLGTTFTTGIYGPSGVAFDATDNTLWVANYVGGTGTANPTYGVAKFLEDGTVAATPYNPAQIQVPVSNSNHELPYAITYCSGGTFAGAFGVGFLSDSTGLGAGEAAGYLAATGTLLGGGLSPIVGNPRALSCSSTGDLYAATDSGLYIFNGTSLMLESAPAGLTAPIFGVFAAY